MRMSDEDWKKTASDANDSFWAAFDQSSERSRMEYVSGAITLLKLHIAAAGAGHGHMHETHDILKSYIDAAAELKASRTISPYIGQHLTIIVRHVRVLSGGTDSRCLGNIRKALMAIGRARTEFPQKSQVFRALEKALLKYVTNNMRKN